MKHNRFQAFMFLAMALSMVLGGQAALAAESKAVRLGLNWKPEPEFGGFYAAQAEKYFEKNGLKAEILEGGAGTPTVQMVASGQIEFGTVSADQVLLARAHGADIKAIYAVYQKNPSAIMVREASGVKSLSELFKTKMTLAIERGLPYAQFLEKKHGFKSVKVVPYTGGVTNFLLDPNFAQQCFVGSEPLIADDKGFKSRTLLVADEGFNPYTTVVVTKASYLKEHPEQVRAFVKAVDEGWHHYLKNSQSAHQLMSKLNPTMPLAQMDRVLKDQIPLIEPDSKSHVKLGQMTEARWQALSDQLFDLKLTKSKVDGKSAFVDLL